MRARPSCAKLIQFCSHIDYQLIKEGCDYAFHKRCCCLSQVWNPRPCTGPQTLQFQMSRCTACAPVSLDPAVDSELVELLSEMCSGSYSYSFLFRGSRERSCSERCGFLVWVCLAVPEGSPITPHSCLYVPPTANCSRSEAAGPESGSR